MQPLRAFVDELPELQREAMRVAVVVLVARADPPESRDLVALLLGELLRFALLLAESAARQVVVDRRQLARGFGGHAGLLAFAPAGFRLAPLAVQKYQQLLARRLHAILAERELRGRLAFSQQPDAVAQALRDLAQVQIARLLQAGARRRRETLGTAVAGQV